jgi:hypothetical protein
MALKEEGVRLVGGRRYEALPLWLAIGAPGIEMSQRGRDDAIPVGRHAVEERA